MSFKNIVAMAVSVALLSGCGATAFKEQREKANHVNTEMNRIKKTHHDLYITAPPVDLTPIKMNKPRTWSDRIPLDMKTTETRLDVVLQDVMRRTGISIFYGKETKKNVAVRIDVHGSLSDLARSIESQTGYKVDLSSENSMSVLAWDTETFSLENLVGKTDFMIGKKSAANLDKGKDSSTDSTSGALFNADQDQYSNIKATSANDIDDTVKTITSILGPEIKSGGSVVANKASGTVTVTARPKTMHKVRQYIDKMNSVNSKQVNIKVRILTFQTTKKNAYGIDWNAVRNTTDGALKFSSSASGGVVDKLDDLGSFSYSATSGKWDGTSVFINALKEQGNVAITTEPSVLVTNNRVGEIERLHKEAYVKEVTIPNINSDSDNSYAQVTQGVVSEGFSMRILPKIMNDEVMMQLSATVSKLGNFGVVDLSNVQIKTPNISEERFNQTIRVHDGMTVVLSGYNQGTTSAGEKKSFDNKALGGNSGSDETSQTIVLLTPVIVQ